MLSFLSWNLAMLERSAQAPAGWGMDQTEALVRRQVLAHDPDIVLFQELPRLVPYIETHGMVRANPQSHSGNLATLVRASLLAADPPEVKTVAGCAILTTFRSLEITIANVHLAPGPGQDSLAKRLDQMAQIVELSPTRRIVIVGDTNTRVAEADALSNAGLVGEPPPKHTWDSKRNRFRKDGARFSAYFTRWFASPGVLVTEVSVWDQPVKEVEGHSFHLSDHYALTGEIHATTVVDGGGESNG